MTGFYLASLAFALLCHLGFVVTYSVLVPNWKKSSIGRMMQWSAASVILILAFVLYNNIVYYTHWGLPAIPAWAFPIAIMAVGVGGLWQTFEVIRTKRRARTNP